MVPGDEPLLEALPFLALEGHHPIQLLLSLPLVELLEVFLEIPIGPTLAAADAADVRHGRRREALAFEDIQVAVLAALVADPAGEVDEGVAVGVRGHLDDVAEALGDPLERHRRRVRRSSRGLVVEVPEDDHLVPAGSVDAFPVPGHVDLGVVGGGGGGCDGPASAAENVNWGRRGFWLKG